MTSRVRMGSAVPRTCSRVASCVVTALVSTALATVADVGVAVAVEPVVVTYATHVDHPAGPNPADLAVVDVDADGIEDAIVVGNTFNPSVSVLLGDGSGGFEAAIALAIGVGEAADLAVGDLDGDGLVDLAIARSTTDEVSVLRGDGTGSFGPHERYATGDRPTSVVTADVNADERLDIVTANVLSDTVSVLLGEVGGTFADRTDFATTDLPRDLVVADFDGDAAPDLAVGGGAEGNASVLLGTGDGAFGPHQVLLAGGSTVASLTTSDFDGDTVADLAISGSGVTVLLGDGDGTFTSSGTNAAGPCGCEVEAADLNGDAVPDVAVGIGGTPAGFETLLGRGDGTFAPRSTFVTAGGAITGVGVGDLDDDGLLDVVVANGLGTLSVLINTPGLPQAPVIGTPSGGDQSATVRWTPPADPGSSPITGYVVTPFKQLRPNVALPATTFDSPATSQTITGLTNDTSYVFRVSAINATGEGQRSAQSTAAYVGRPPRAPTIGAATAGVSSARVTWTAPAPNGGPAITGYLVTPFVGYFALPSRSFNATATARTITGLTNGTTYRFKVAAVNAVGAGPASSASNPVTPVAVPPGAPTIGVAVAGNGEATVSWTAPASDGGSPITGYVVTPSIGYYPLPPQTFASTATTQVATGLANGTTYRFRVQAINAVGTSAHSAATNAVTPSP